jgi:hypothetical protein
LQLPRRDEEKHRERFEAARKEAEIVAERKNILDWTSTLDQSGRFCILIEAHHIGTNQWFMHRNEFIACSTYQFPNPHLVLQKR